jgi:hypothetical protein
VVFISLETVVWLFLLLSLKETRYSPLVLYPGCFIFENMFLKCVCVCMCVCVCVCVREREREREIVRQGDRKTGESK